MHKRLRFLALILVGAMTIVFVAQQTGQQDKLDMLSVNDRPPLPYGYEAIEDQFAPDDERPMGLMMAAIACLGAALLRHADKTIKRS